MATRVAKTFSTEARWLFSVSKGARYFLGTLLVGCLTHALAAVAQLHHAGTPWALLPTFLGCDAEDLLRGQVFRARIRVPLAFAKHTGPSPTGLTCCNATLHSLRGYR